LITPQQDFVVYETSKKNPNGKWRGENSLSRIKRRGKLRVGFYKDSNPFAFFNKDTALVGYGIDLAHLLAMDLDVSLEFLPIKPGNLITAMNKDHIDIFMSDIFLSSRYAEELELSKPYLNVSLALLTPIENNKFNDFSTTSKLDTFTISYIDRKEIAEQFLSYFPKGGAYALPEINDYLQKKLPKDQKIDSTQIDSIVIDAHLTSAERASNVTVLHPNYKVVNPLPYHLSNSLVFPISEDNVWRRYVDKWIDFRKQDGSFERIYDQWILGEPHVEKLQKWSILENIIRPAIHKDTDSIEKDTDSLEN
jgi:ABC-type amino acid transport substrate-binding protein